jgi:hypothetical protein
MTLGEEYLRTVSRLRYYKQLGEKTFEQLEEKDFHWQPSSESNSIAVIIQHLSGNMLSRWTNFLTEDGEKDWRQRDDEFESHDYSKQQLIDIWNKGWDCLLNELDSLTEADLLKTVYIRKEPLSAIDAITRQVAHYSYHVGQIVYIGRIIKNENWKNLSIPKHASKQYNQSAEVKDPAKNFSR